MVSACLSLGLDKTQQERTLQLQSCFRQLARYHKLSWLVIAPGAHLLLGAAGTEHVSVTSCPWLSQDGHLCYTAAHERWCEHYSFRSPANHFCMLERIQCRGSVWREWDRPQTYSLTIPSWE